MSCPSCGRELPGEFPFCPHCGAAVAGAPPAERREERKVVTVLFADLVGFTSRAERLDPEDVRALLERYHDHLREELERFGGTVEKFIGDAVMALFGAPAAHEDDPERAVRAALAIRDWAREPGQELQVRIGVNTGEALVTLDARPAEGESMAAGDVVNTAARLQAAAPLNGILVGEQTVRATEHTIDYEEHGAVAAKGKRSDVRAWEAVQARARAGGAVEPHAPLVGRSRELELLGATLARVREERWPQLVTVVGVPGIGKTRIVQELARVVDGDRDLMRWRQGRSLSYGEGITFWSLAEIVKAEAGILESDAPALAQAKLERTVGALGVDAAEAQWLEGHLRALVGLADAASATQDEAFAAWRRFLEALAEQRPLVLVFEDLHWAGDALLDFVDSLVDRVSGVALLILATARPELLQRRSGWGGGKPNALTLSLPPLSDGDTTALVRALLDLPELESGNRDALVARAGGNPLFAEQYARALRERGDVGEVPATVQGIIAARLDALPAEEKRLLQGAAVIGKVFWTSALAAVDGGEARDVDPLLHALERKEFIQRARSSSIARETEYVFRHSLIRDVAYGQIPRAARSAKHERAAAWIAARGRDDDRAETIAYHYLQALELAEAAGRDASALVTPARRALRDAGDRAAALYAAEGAERFYDAALRLWPEDDPERLDLLYRRALPIGHHVAGGDPIRIGEARDALLAAGETARAAELEMMLAQTYRIHGEADVSDAHGQRALALIEGASPSRSSAWVLARLAATASLRGEHARAIELATEARTIAEEFGFDDVLTEAVEVLGVQRVFMGDVSGLADLERGLELAAASGSLGALGNAHNSVAVANQVLGDLRAAYTARLEVASTAERIGSESLRRWCHGILIDHRYRLGEWDEAHRLADEFLAVEEAGEPNLIAWQVFGVRAEMRLARGDPAGATTDAEAALALGRSVREVQSRTFVLAAAAHVLATTAPDRAAPIALELVDALRDGVDMQFAVINLPLLASAVTSLGFPDELASALEGYPASRWTRAVAAYLGGEFVRAADLLREIGALPDEAEARLRAVERLLAAGRRGDAGEQLQLALAFYRSVNALRRLEECTALLTV